jgi:hypothetical protein
MSVGRFVVVSLVVLDHEKISKSKIENGFGLDLECSAVCESKRVQSTEDTR